MSDSKASADWFAKYLAGDQQARKEAPLARGLFGYFPNACLHVAHVSFVANAQHNPGLPMQWAFNKSSDESDCVLRHAIDAAGAAPFDDDGLLHLSKKAWRAMAELERYVLEHYPNAQRGASVTGFQRNSPPAVSLPPLVQANLLADLHANLDKLAVLP